MRITDDAEARRVEDAQQHDEVFVMIGDPDTDRPLLKLSVTKDGDAVIEYDDGDLAAGIRALSDLLSMVINRADDNGPGVLDAVRTVFQNLDAEAITLSDLRWRLLPQVSTRQMGDALVRLTRDGEIERVPGTLAQWRPKAPAERKA